MSSNVYLGNTNIETLYLGTSAVTAIYLGETEVYSAGPFVGLKLSPSTISFLAYSGLTSSLKVKSSEPWTLVLPNDATWLSASTLSGVSGETTVTLSTTEENTANTRTAVITATTTSFSATCTVNQNKKFVDNYMFNYNAKEYDATTHSFPKKNGQTFDEDLVLNTDASSVSTDYVSINGQYMLKQYNSNADNPLNRGGSFPKDFTFIYKAKFTNTSQGNNQNIFANRCPDANYNYFIRYGFFYAGNNIEFVPSQQPCTIVITIDSQGNGLRKCIETQQTATNVCNYGNNTNGFGFFSGFGNKAYELFVGDFYWMFCATRKLTDEEIQTVIDYNENL